MKFDINKPHGVVFGISHVKYTQNGIEYDGSGNPVESTPAAAPVKVNESVKAEESGSDVPVAKNDVESAKEFLRNILSNGPVAKSAVFSEADKNNQNWGVVKDAAADMGVKSIQMGAKKQEFWQFNRG